MLKELCHYYFFYSPYKFILLYFSIFIVINNSNYASTNDIKEIKDTSSSCVTYYEKGKCKFYIEDDNIWIKSYTPAKTTELNLSSFELPVIGQSDKKEQVNNNDTINEQDYVVDTNKWPYLFHALLSIKYDNNTQVLGGGALIGPHHMLTSAHNVFCKKHKGWAVDISVYLGIKDDLCNFGEIKAKRIYTFSQWREEENQDYNLALISLDRSIGFTNGWCGVLCSNDADLSRMKHNITSYQEKGGYNRMLNVCPTLYSLNEEHLYYEINDKPIQEGSCIWATQGGIPYIIGIHNTLSCKEGDFSSGVRISKTKIQKISDWMSDSLFLQILDFQYIKENDKDLKKIIHLIDKTVIYQDLSSAKSEEKERNYIKGGFPSNLEHVEWPYSTHGKLIMEYSEGKYRGSGCLIGPNHLLTAAHNIYNHNTKEWAKDILLLVQLKNITKEINAAKVYTFAQWVENKDPKYDIALVLLKFSIGLETGWNGLRYLEDKELLQKEINFTIYSSVANLKEIKTVSDKIKKFDSGNIYYSIDTSHGQSGGAIWIDESASGIQSPYIIGIHTHKEGQLYQGNFGVRLSRNKIKHIIKWMEESYKVKSDTQEKIHSLKCIIN